MRLNTKGRLAVSAMVDLALHQDAGPVALACICRRQHISQSYLEVLFHAMRRHDLVQSTRGPGGGYMLARRSEEISVADVIAAVDELMSTCTCGAQEGCQGENSERCMTHDLWAGLSSHLLEFINSISLRKLADEKLALGVAIEIAGLRSSPKSGISKIPVVKPTFITGPNSVFAMGAALNKGPIPHPGTDSE